MERLFFIHIMKTAGTSFRYLIMRNCAPGTVYPYPSEDADLARAYSDPAYLLDLSDSRKESIRALMGHFPYATVE